MAITIKYIVWFPEFPNKNKTFDNKEVAIKFCKQQKIEAYVNQNLNKNNEDTIYGNKYINKKGKK